MGRRLYVNGGLAGQMGEAAKCTRLGGPGG